MSDSKKVALDRETPSKLIDLAQPSTSGTKRDEITPDKNSKTKPSKSTRKRKRRHSSTDDEDDEEIDSSSIDFKLKQSAIRNNLTPQNVKNILQKVVRNDHVLAIVKLKEEALEKQEKASKDTRLSTESIANTSRDSVNDVIDDSGNAVPKLTRAKAKELNKFPLPVAPIKHTEPDSEVVALIREELHSDDDDEEYQPGEDDIESDDDLNTTTSDIDSQPATPSSQADPSEELTHSVYTQDGLFKVPRARNDSNASHSEQEYIIAQRTRSKISLAETPIEAIESNFRAPDTTPDMYQLGGDLDPTYVQFLSGFTKPLTPEIEKDEETDPDYFPAILDLQPDDREEFQSGYVPKKELNDLLAEILGDYDISQFQNDWFPDVSSFTQAVNADELDSTLVTPVKQIDEVTDKTLETPDPNKMQCSSQAPIESPILSNQINYFDPNSISTPAKMDCSTNSISATNQTQQSHNDSFNSTLLAVNETMQQPSTPYPLTPYAFSPLQDKSPLFVPVMTFGSNSNTQPNIPIPYSPIIITMPSQAITTPTIPSTVISSVQLNESSNNTEILQLNEQLQSRSMPKRPGCRSKKARFKSARYKDLEDSDPNLIQPKIFYGVDERGFTVEQRQILEMQLRMHVQLATQSYIQTYGHPELYTVSYTFKRFLTDFEELVNSNKSKVIHNLKPALELISSWEDELSKDTKENSELFKHLQDEMNKFRKNMSYVMQFHERILRLICGSKVFIYPDLLPATPFRFNSGKAFEYLPSEDYLLAFLLEHFYDELERKSISYKFAKPKKVTLSSVCQHIAAHIGYLRPSKSIYDYVRLRAGHKKEFNPIQFYFKYKRAPPVRHRYEIFNPDYVVEPARQPLDLLPEQWARYVQKLVALKRDEILQKINTPTLPETPQIRKKELKAKRIKTDTNTNSPVQQYQKDFNLNFDGSLIQVKILYEPKETEINRISVCKTEKLDTPNTTYDGSCDIQNNHPAKSLDKGQTLLTSFFRPIQIKKVDEIDDNSVEYFTDIDEPDNLVINDYEEPLPDRKLILWHREHIRRKYNRIIVRKFLIRKLLHLKIAVQLASKIRKQYSPHWHRFRKNKNVRYVYRCLLTYELTCMLFEQTKRRRQFKMTTEALVINRRVQKILNENNTNMRDSNEENPTPVHNTSDAGAKRPPKNQRTSDNARQLLFTENVQESVEKDILFAQRFLDRVEETFINENEHHKFSEFIDILRNFSENQTQHSGADFYLILEKFFMPDYPELMDLVLYFLQPSDAVEINKAMDYFLKVNFGIFLKKLNILKQPAQIRKVMSCLKELSEDPDVTIDRVRARILPLLKGNQLLIDWFLQCVGPDKCESSKDEYETLVLRKGNESFDEDQFEYIPHSDILPDPIDNPCHIRFMNGRIFYGNRYPLPAKLSFSAMPCSSMTSELTEADRQLLLGGGDKHVHYSCVHNIKEFADNKMRDKHHSELEPAGGVGSSTTGTVEEGYNSDDEQQCVTPIDKVEEKHFDEDIENTIPSNVAASDVVLCDNTLLRAHSVRLNPSLHPALGNANTELLNKLKPPEQLSSEANKEARLSPKKQASAKYSTNTHLKSSQTRKTNSPNAKKTPTGCKSPKKTTSPISLAPENPEDRTSIQAIQDSNAVQTAKKLKRFLETDDPTPSTSQSLEMDNGSSKRINTHMLSRPIKKRKRGHEYQDSGDESENTEESVKREEPKSTHENETQKDVLQPEWTREEDRHLLEQIKAGLDLNAEDCAHQFPNKTQEQIKHRREFLIDFLTKNFTK